MQKENLSNSLNNSDPYSRHALVECSILTNIGIYCLVLFIVSIILNGTLIWILIKHRKKLLDSINTLILSLSMLSMLGTLIELPMVAIAAFSCK